MCPQPLTKEEGRTLCTLEVWWWLRKGSSLVAQWVKDLTLSLQWLGSLLWLGFDPWPGNSHMPQVWQKKKKKNAQGEWKNFRKSCLGNTFKKHHTELLALRVPWGGLWELEEVQSMWIVTSFIQQPWNLLDSYQQRSQSKGLQIISEKNPVGNKNSQHFTISCLVTVSPT